jgi:hypothetical protein
MLLDTELSDLLPTFAAVDLLGCTQSNKYGVPVIEHNGAQRIEDKELFGNGYFEYWCLGCSKDNVYVLETALCGGGSGVFENLLFVRFVKDQIIETGKSRERTMIVLCGSYVLGDRDSRQVQVSGDHVTVGSPQDGPNFVTIPIPAPQGAATNP